MANGSFLLTYATQSVMAADTGQPDGTFAQVIDDPTAANNTNYQSTSGVWSTVATNLFGVDVPDLFNLGASTTLLSAAIKAGEIHLIAHGICAADGSTDDSGAINTIAGILEGLGGGKIVFDRVDDPSRYYRLEASPILLRNNVVFEGCGSSSFIRNTNTTDVNMGACFHGNCITQKNYFLLPNKYPLNDVAVDDRSIFCTTASDAGNFSVGQVVLIFTSGSDGGEGNWGLDMSGKSQNFAPFFSRQYRVTSVDAGTGEVGLDWPVPVALTNGANLVPRISDGTGIYFGPTQSSGMLNGLVDRPVVRNLRLAADSADYGKTITGGMFEGLVENIWVDTCRSIILGNAHARSRYRKMRGYFTERAIELATGSHDSHVDQIVAAYRVGTGAAGTLAILAAEYTANNEYSNFYIDGPDFFVSPGTPTAVTLGPCTGLRVHDGYIRCKGRGLTFNDQEFVSTSDIEFRNVLFDLSDQGTNLDVFDKGFSNLPESIRLRNVQFTGDAPSTAACRFQQNCGIDFDDVGFSTGGIDVLSTAAPTGRMTRITYDDWLGPITDLNQTDKHGMIRTSGQGAYSAGQNLVNTTSTSTSANHVVATFTLPAGLSVTGRDQIVVEATGTVGTNTAASKTIAFDEGHGVVLTQTIAAGDKGAFSFRAVVTLESDTATSTAVSLTYPISPATQATGFLTTASETRRTGLTIGASGLTITLQGWIGGAGPTITFNSINMFARLYGD